MLRETDDGVALLVEIVNNEHKKVGLFSAHKGSWRASFISGTSLRAYNILLNDDKTVEVVENKKNTFLRNMGYSPEADEGETLQKTSITGSNYCGYTKSIGSNVACWSPSENPFGRYFVVTYRRGDAITWNHYTWRADYKGRGIVCPLSKTYVQNWVQCGFPPD